MEFTRLALSLFGDRVRNNEKYSEVRRKLRSAHIFTPYDEYVSTGMLYSLLVAVVIFIFGLIIAYILVSSTGFPTLYMNPGFADIASKLTPYKNILSAFLAAFFAALLVGYGAYKLYMSMPYFQASIRKVKIDTQLPHAITYMYSLSRGETNIVQVIRSIAGLSNVYGEISNEFAMVLRDMELLGVDLMTALANVQSTTPSESFRTFIGNLVTVVDTGGDITEYLGMQIENLRTKARSEQTLFLEMLGLVAESYVTGFVAGPLFIITMGVTLGSMQSSMNTLLVIITYAVLPIGSVAFIIFIDMIVPKDEHRIGLLTGEGVDNFLGIRVKKEEEEALYKVYYAAKKKRKLVEFLRNPLKSCYEDPSKVLYISAPAALLVILYAFIINLRKLTGYVAASNNLTDYILLALIVGIVPYLFFYEVNIRKIRKVEGAIPQFLKDISTVNETGLSLAESIRVLLRTEQGVMRRYVEKIYTHLRWGCGTAEAFMRFADTVRANTLSRVVTLITKASETSGDITGVLDIATKDALISLQLKKDKYTSMIIYIIIIYITFLVFLYIVYTLSTTFIPEMAKAGKIGLKGFTAAPQISPGFYSVYFYHTALIQGFFSGLIAGVMGEGNPRSGLKHSIIMILTAYLAFKVFVPG